MKEFSPQENSNVSAFYSGRTKAYEAIFTGFLKWDAILKDFFFRYHYLEPGMKILDAGCGTGAVTKAIYGVLEPKSWGGTTIHAFDITASMLDSLREWVRLHNLPGIGLREADVLHIADQLPVEWSDYDLIVSATMIEYIQLQHISTALRTLARLLKRDGRMVVLVTRQTALTRLLATRWWRAKVYSPQELTGYIQDAGLGNIQFRELREPWNRFVMAAEISPE